MTLAAETLQVHLVNAWWEQLLPLLAILISLLSIALTLCFRYVDRLNLTVDTSQSMFIGDPRGGADRINVRVTNKSPTMTTHITSLTLELPNGNRFAYLDVGPVDDMLPKTIGPGESASLSYPAEGLGTALEQMRPKPQWIRALAVSGHKDVRGKKDRKMATSLRTYSTEHLSTAEHQQ